MHGIEERGFPAAPATDQGFVQILLLVALATIAAVLTAVLIGARQNVLYAKALDRMIRTEALAASGFQRLGAAILDHADDLEQAALEGTDPPLVTLADARLALTLEGEGGKIDLLRADMALLTEYLVNAALPAAAQARLIADIAAARDSKDGAAARDAVRLALLDSLSNAQIDADFTILGTTAGIDPRYASERVLAAVPDLDPGDLAALLAMPEAERTQQGLSRYFESGGRRFSLVVKIDQPPFAPATRRLPIELSTSGRVLVLGAPY